MYKLIIFLLFVTNSLLGQSNPTECDCKVKTEKVVTFNQRFNTPYAATTNPKWLEKPVIEVDFKSSAKKFIITISMIAHPQDSYTVLKVLLDDKEIPGHMVGNYLSPERNPEYDELVISIPHENSQTPFQGTPRPFTFTAISHGSKKKKHKLEIFLAGCCSGVGGNSSAAIIAPTIIIERCN